MIKKLSITLICAIGIINACKEPYKNQNLSPEERANDLVNRLTLNEKVSLMMNSSDSVTRLGIKKYDWWNEALHGVARNGIATVFPQAIGMAASFDNTLLKEVFTVVSDEARIKNRQAREKGEMKRYTGLTMWTPNINIFRDPRWGRGQETYGEDPYLTGIMGVAVIKGLQGEPENGIDKLHACAKHYAVHSGPEWNRHSFDAKNISPRDLWETYLPAFKNAVIKGGVKEVMCAYNRFEGSPCCGSNLLLYQILRDQWGYNGIVLSDCGAIRNFYMEGRHMTHPDREHAVASAVVNGTDLECGSSYKGILNAVEQGLISEDAIDVSLKRLMKARYELGEMDGVSPWNYLSDTLIDCILHQDIALLMAQKSMVLLKNDGILPLNKNIHTIAVLGPNANDSIMQWGNYHGTPKHTITLLEALKNEIPDTEIIYDKISDHTGTTASVIKECKIDNITGIKSIYWNNTIMEGEPSDTLYYKKEIKIGKRDTISKNINLQGISAKLNTVFSPGFTGQAEFVFTTDSKVKLKINGQKTDITHTHSAIKYAYVNVIDGKKYQIEIDWIHEKQGQFKFDIKKRIEPDYAKINSKVKNADIVVFAGGISSSLEREEGNVYAPGFMGGDRTSIELPEVQRKVIASLKKNGKKIILVNFSGSAMGLVPESKDCDAILQAWYPGEAGGKAITSVLFGEYNPAGRLPVTFYKNVNQLPDFENYNMSGRTYRYLKEEPLYPFGYGLSYTTFKYGKTELSKNTVQSGESLIITVPVTNSGKVDGDEVVQVYLKKLNDTEGPDKALCAFKRIFIPKGETQLITFELNQDNLQWWDDINQKMHVHKGEYQLMVGSSSLDGDLMAIDFKMN